MLKSLRLVGVLILFSHMEITFASELQRDEGFTKRTVAELVANFKKGDFTVPYPEVIKAAGQGYVPAAGEPSIQELEFKYKIRSQSAEFFKGVEPLCYRGNPNAWVYWGTRLSSQHLAEQDDAFFEGVALLMMASVTGSPVADNMLGSFLNVMGKQDLSLSYYKKGVGFPFCDVNYGLELGDKDGFTADVLAILERAANAGDPTGASAMAEAYIALGDKVEALKWLYISYRGPMSMDRFYGIIYLLEFIRKNPLSHEEGQQAQNSAEKWFAEHPGVLLDGFDQDLYGAKPLYKLDHDYFPPVDSSSPTTYFWTTYAVGKKEEFRRTLEALFNNDYPVAPNKSWFEPDNMTDARALLAYMLQGFGGPRNSAYRAYLLGNASGAMQPLALFDSYFHIVTSGAFQGDVDLGFKTAYELTLAAVDTWFPDEPDYNNAIADLRFLLGYVKLNGLGTDKDEKKGLELIEKVRHTSAMAFGYMAALEKEPLDSYAQSMAVYPNFTVGDSFNGFVNARALGSKLNKEQRIEGSKIGDEYCKKFPMIADTIYSRNVLGLGLKHNFVASK